MDYRVINEAGIIDGIKEALGDKYDPTAQYVVGHLRDTTKLSHYEHLGNLPNGEPIYRKGDK